SHPELPPAAVARALRERPAQPHRRAVVVRQGEDASALLAGRDPARTVDGAAPERGASAVFLFPGVGEQYPGMARGLYAAEPVFRAEVDRCAGLLRGHLGFDVLEALFAEDDAPSGAGMDLRRLLGRAPASPAAARLSRTEVAQPVAFAVGYALARLWESRGVRPAMVMGHSLGEYTAACAAGVFTLEDALELVALRARAIQALPAGAMLAVSLSPEAARPWLGGGVALAAVNAPELCVLSGAEAAIERVQGGLVRAGHAVRRLATTHAFHSPLMEPVAREMAGLAGRMRLSAPSIPLVSNVTGRPLTAAQAVDPGHWARHLVGTVHFAAGAAELLAEEGRVLVELGPGGSLGAFVRQQAAALGVPVPPGVASLPHAAEGTAEPAHFHRALGQLWTAGVRIDPAGLPDAACGGPAPLPAGLFEPDGGVPEHPPAAKEAAEREGGEEDGPGSVRAQLAVMWRELLGVAPRPDDDFFALGGHSLVAAQLIARVRGRFGVEMRLRTLFQTRTLSGMARWIADTIEAAGA
ncbi:MAG TPA: acyltransferase domain-containing protein, partial [Longimicrobium sp.]|nr:acyltransferase domain-containing protein [Longimicrobium sp.]